MDEIGRGSKRVKRERNPEKRKMLLSRAKRGVEIQSESVEMRSKRIQNGCVII